MNSSLGFSSYATNSSSNHCGGHGSGGGGGGGNSSGNGTKKRPSCLKKNNSGTAKQHDGLVTRFLTPATSLQDESPDANVSESFQETMENNQSRTNRINELLAKITSPASSSGPDEGFASGDPNSSYPRQTGGRAGGGNARGGGGGAGNPNDEDEDDSRNGNSTNLLPFPIISQNEAGSNPSMGNLASLVESRNEGFSDIASTSSIVQQKPLSAANGISFEQSTRYRDAYDPSQVSFVHESSFADGDGNGSSGGGGGFRSKPHYSVYYGKGGRTATSGSSGGNDFQDSIMQKMNYVTHMLEEMQLERTNNVTEELVLYSFLGIFVIFVVDSFARGGGHGLGRYTR